MNIELRKVSDIKPYTGNPRVNAQAVDAVAASMRRFGFRQPIVLDADGTIIAGHTRWLAAKKLKLDSVPVHVARDMTPEHVRAYRLADNKTHELSKWDDAMLLRELESLSDEHMEEFGFTAEDVAALKGEEITSQVNPPAPPTMTWALIGIPTVRFGEIATALESLASVDGIICEVTANNDDQD